MKKVTITMEIEMYIDEEDFDTEPTDDMAIECAAGRVEKEDLFEAFHNARYEVEDTED